MKEMFTWFSKLGKMKKLEAPMVVITNGTYPNTPYNGTWATCDADAQFEAGSAKIRMVLKRDGGSWFIMGFYINSPALMAPNG